MRVVKVFTWPLHRIPTPSMGGSEGSEGFCDIFKNTDEVVKSSAWSVFNKTSTPSGPSIGDRIEALQRYYKKLQLSYCNKETLLFTIHPNYANLA